MSYDTSFSFRRKKNFLLFLGFYHNKKNEGEKRKCVLISGHPVG